jgi:hypothetical protein
MNSDDEALVDDSELLPDIVSVSDQENAWIDLNNAREVMYYPKDKEDLIRKMSLGEEWDSELAAEIVRKNQETYAYIESAVDKKYFSNPGFNGLKKEDYRAALILETPDFRALNRIYLISAKSDLLAGDFDSGIRKILNSISIGNKIKGNLVNAILIEYLVGLGIAQNTYLFIENVNSEFQIYKNNSVVLQKKLEESKDNEKGLARIWKLEYLMMRNEVINLSSREYLEENLPQYSEAVPNDSSFYFKQNESRNMIMRKFKRDIENSYRSCDNLIPFEKEADLGEMNKLSFLLTENVIGKILIDIATVSSDPVQEKRCMEDFRVTDLQVQLASSAYRIDNGFYPGTIRELIESGYLVIEIPEKLHGWDVKYDQEKGKLVLPDGFEK